MRVAATPLPPLFPLLLAAALLAGACAPSGGPVVIDPPPPPPPSPRALPEDAGRASFFLPIRMPLAELRRQVDEAVPRQIEEERRQELSGLLEGESWRLLARRGAVDVGFRDGRFVVRFPLDGRLTVRGTLRPVPLAPGVAVRESVDFSGVVTGTVEPSLAPDWEVRLDTRAALDLSRAEVELFGLVTLSLRDLLQAPLEPIVERELRRAAAEALAGWDLRRKAAEAWTALHFAGEVAAGQGLRVRFRPEAVRLARLRAEEGVLRTGIAIAGRLELGLAGALAAPPPAVPLPPPGVVEDPAGRLEIDLPLLLSEEALSRIVARRLEGRRHRLGVWRLTFTAVRLQVVGDALVLAVDFRARGPFARGAEGRLFLRGQPAFDPAARSLRLTGLEYDLATRSRLLQSAEWLLRSDLLSTLEKETSFDLAPLLGEAQERARQAVGGLDLPAGLESEIALDEATVTDLVVADGYLFARTRITGS